MIPVWESKLGPPIMAAMEPQAAANFSIYKRHSLINCSFSNRSWGKGPQIANSGNIIRSAPAVLAFSMA